MKRKILALTLVFALVLGMVPAVSAATSGSCGENLIWRISGTTLTISGTGDMAYYSGAVSVPWYDSRASITKVVVEEGVTSLADPAFYGFTAMTSVSLPEGLTTIGFASFDGCASLEEITIPASVTKIGGQAFDGCTGLKAVHISDLDAWLRIEIGNLWGNPAYYAGDLLLNGEPVTEVVFPEGITEVPSCLFVNCKSLTKVTIPEGVKTIGGGAFSYCSNLKSCPIPDSVTAIEGFAFSGCSRLEGISIPSGVTVIGDSAFLGCNMKSAVIPAGVTEIGPDAFCNCSQLEQVTLPQGLTAIGDRAFNDCFLLKNVKIPQTVQTIGEYAFGQTAITTVTLPDKLTQIASGAFFSCEQLKSIRIPAGVTRIGNDAFRYCSSLSAVYFYGTEAQWKAIQMGSNNEALTNATIYYNCDRWTDLVEMGVSLEEFLSKPNLVIAPVDEQDSGKLLTGVTAVTSLGTAGVNGRFVIEAQTAAADGVRLTKDGYHDYILPAEVAGTMVSLSMTKAGVYTQHQAVAAMTPGTESSYISTVFCRETGSSKAYADAHVAEVYGKDGTAFDFIMSGVGLEGATYYIAQSESRKISSANGRFSGIIPADIFVYGETVYAYAVLPNGAVTPAVTLTVHVDTLSEQAENLLNSTSFSLMGEEGSGVSIDAGVPLWGGSQLNFKGFTGPIGVSIDGRKVRISIGLDIFSSKSENGGKFETKSGWDAFKKSFKGMVANAKESGEALDHFCNFAKNFGTNASYIEESFGISAKMLGYVEAELIDGKVVITDSQIATTGKLGISHTTQASVLFVPVYISATAEAKFTISATVARATEDPAAALETSLALGINPSLEVEGGIGIKDAVSVGIYAQGEANYYNDFSAKEHSLKLAGQVGVRAQLFTLEGSKVLLSGEVGVFDTSYGKNTLSASAYGQRVNGMGQSLSVVDRDYLGNTSQWLGGSGGVMPLSGNALGTQLRILQSGVYPNTQSAVVSAQGKVFLVFVADDPGRDTWNRQKLVYSVYDVATDTWTEPKAVWDDGHNDGYPALAVSGDTVHIVWQKINHTLTEADCATAQALLEKGEICYASYDLAAGTLSGTQMLTENGYYDFDPCVAVENGQAVIYYGSCPENDLLSSDGFVLNRMTMGGEAQQIAESLSYITGLNATSGKLAFVMAAAGYVWDGSAVSRVSDKNIASILYGKVAGEDRLFLCDGGNIHYSKNGVWTAVFPENRGLMSQVQFVQAGENTAIFWTEGQPVNQLYMARYAGGVWTEPVLVSAQPYRLSFLHTVYTAQGFMGVCNATEMTGPSSDGVYTEGETALAAFTVRDFADIALDPGVYFEEADAVPGAGAKLRVLVTNRGTIPLDRLQFTLTDTLGTDHTVVLDVALPSGSTREVELSYPVPQNYGSTVITVRLEIPGHADEDLSNNQVSFAAGKADLTVSEASVSYAGERYIITAAVENYSSVPAGAVTMYALLGDPNGTAVSEIELGTVDSSRHSQVQLMLHEYLLDFDSNGMARVYLKVSGSGEDANPGDNVLCVLLVNERTKCGHPVSQKGTTVAPGCLTQGYTNYTCRICNTQYKGDFTDATGHSYTYAVTAVPTEQAGGTLTGTCGCGETVTAELPALTEKDYTYEILVQPTYTAAGTGRYTWKETLYGDVFVDVAIPELTAPAERLEILTFPTKTEYVLGEALDTAGLALTLYRQDGESETVTEGFTVTGFDNQTPGLQILTVDYEGVQTTFTVVVKNSAGDISGQAGPELYYLYTDHNKTLLFYGKGYMYWNNPPRWYDVCKKAENVVIQSGATSIGDYAFTNFIKLKNVTIPDTVRKIGIQAFYNCTALEEIRLPETMNAIGRDAFRNTGLKAIQIPEGIKIIEESVFRGCGALEEVSLPSTIEEIGWYAFEGCNVLQKVHVTDIGRWCQLDVDNSDLMLKGPKLYHNGEPVTQVVIPDGITVIHEEAFFKQDLISIWIPKSVTWIEDFAFGYSANMPWHVLYEGTQAQWDKITFGYNKAAFDNCIFHYSTDPVAMIPYPQETCTHIYTYACPLCEELLGQEKETPEHTMVTQILQEPGVGRLGYLSYACSNCSLYKQVQLPSLNSTDYTVKQESVKDCDTDGVTSYTWKETAYGEQIFYKVDKASGHDYQSSYKAPTCKEEGYYRLVCRSCGAVGFEEIYEKSHVYQSGIGTVIQEPTCLEPGKSQSLCIHCGVAAIYHTLPKLEHVYNHYTQTATCTQVGGDVTECVNGCGYRLVEKTAEMLPHSYGAWEQTQAPGCETDGERQKVCTGCGDVKTQPIPGGHSYTSKVTAPTCTDAGFTTYTCTACGHSYTDSEVTAPGHSYGDWQVISEASCKGGGIRVRECGVCGEQEREFGEALPHNYQVNTRQPDCKNRGIRTYTCPDCGKSYTEYFGEALGHDYVLKTEPATCLKPGYTYYSCTRCGDAYKNQDIDALGHDYVAYVTKPGCVTEGYTHYLCSRCSSSYRGESLPAAGHSWGQWTAGNDGRVKSTCVNCTAWKWLDALPTVTDPAAAPIVHVTASGEITLQLPMTQAVWGNVVCVVGEDGSYTILPETAVTASGVSIKLNGPCRIAVINKALSFPDVGSDNWSKNHTDYMTARGLMSGKLDGTFGHAEPIQRRTVAMMLWRLAGSPQVTGDCPFTDVTQDRYYQAILWAYQNGIISGYTDGTFRSTVIISRQHFAAMLHRYAVWTGVEIPTANNGKLTDFSDYGIMNSRMHADIQWALDCGLIYGRSGGIYDPAGSTSRAQMTVILTRFLEKFYAAQ